jgi:hypothetical protein
MIHCLLRIWVRWKSTGCVCVRFYLRTRLYGEHYLDQFHHRGRVEEVMNPRIECGGLAGRPRADLYALDMSRLRFEREPTLPTKLGTKECAASPLLYGATLNRARGLTQCVVRETVG